MATIELAKVTNKYFLKSLQEYLKKEHSEENYLFMVTKATNEVVYNTYIKVGTPLEVNISDALRKPLVALAATKKWSSMNTPMLAARKEIIKVVSEDSLPRFLVTPEGKRANFMLTLKLDSPKAETMVGLLTVYKSPRTPEDKQAAYDAMLKLAAMALLNPALRTLGVEPPAKVLPKKGDPAKALKLMGVPSKLVPQMTKLIEVYRTAGSDRVRAEALAQMDTVAKGVVKHDAIVAGLKGAGLI